MKQHTKESERHIDSVLRALDVLDCFLYEPKLSIKEIIKKTGLTRSRIMRLAGTLEYRGYLVRDLESNAYLIGTRSAGLGKSFERINNTETIVRPVLKYLVEQTGESATFYIADGVERVALLREEGTHAIRLSIIEGQRTPIHAGASGKILLAFGDPIILETLIANKSLCFITDKTITSIDQLIAEIQTIRKNKYATSIGENIPGAHAIAAPIFNYANILIGSIGLAAPANRFADIQMKSRIKTVIDAAKTLSKRYGFIEK